MGMRMKLSAAAICIAISGVSHAQQTNSGDQHLRGTWLVKVYPHGLTAPLLGTDLNQFGCDGTEIAPTSMGDVGLPPGVTGDSAGTGTGTYVSTGKGSFPHPATSLSIIAQADFFDLNWNVLFTAQSDAYGTRLPTPNNGNSSRCQ